MNEELKIIIRAVTSEAEKNLAGVRQELKKIEETANDSGKVIDKAIATIGKGAAAAVAGITALTTAMVALGKSSMEFRKVQAQLIAGFNSVGLSAQQAGEVYKELYGFLGDHNQAAEAANLLAQLTQEEANLAQWTDILMGVYAKFPSSLPVESLAEAVNHTAQLGEVQGTLADALEWVGVNVESFNAALADTNSVAEREALIRGTLNGLYIDASRAYSQANQALIAYNQSQLAVDQALADATAYVIPLMTALNNLSATLLSVLKPAFETVAAVIIVFVQWIIAAIKAIGSFFGIFSSGSKTTETVADSVSKTAKSTNSLNKGVQGLGSSLGGAAKAAKELKRQTMGFDELNIMSSQPSAASGGGGGGGGAAIDIPEIEIPEISELELPGLAEFEEKVAKIRETLIPIVVLIGAVTAGLLLWKIADFLSDLKAAYDILNMPLGKLFSKFGTELGKAKIDEASAAMEVMLGKLKMFGGMILIIAGAILLVKGYSDAWINGLDWGNFAMILGGIAAIVGGIALAFGPLAAAIALSVGGVVALVIGIKDLITNGYSMQGVLMVLAGAVAVVVGVIWALNAALLANPITWIVVALMALVAAFVILWNECEGFRKFWINLWDNIKKITATVVDAIVKFFTVTIPETFRKVMSWLKTNVCEPIANFYAKWIKPVVDKLIEIVKKLVEMIGALFVGLWNLLKQSVIDPIAKGFTNLWNGIKQVWQVAKQWFNDNVVKPVANIFSQLWKKIKDIFSPVINFFSEKFTGAFNKIKEIFSKLGPFFSGLWDTIKSTFAALGTKIGDAIGNAVKSGINGIISRIESTINKAIRIINGAIDLINLLPGVSVGKIGLLSMPRLATGGITTGATIAMIGERGKEAVLPLENNTGWMDILAERVAARNAAPTKIVLMVNERELGWASINGINGITKQTGGIQLQLV